MGVSLLTSTLLVLLAVGIHLMFLESLSALLPYLQRLKRARVAVVIIGAIIGHLVEIAVFAVGITLLATSGQYGYLQGDFQPAYRDYFYYSAVSFTSLGFGDLTPKGPLRLVTSIEALTGLVLIAWTASYTFVTMEHSWKQK